jgi:uncharacterized protein with ParB-like and HNH nuclease domain
LEGYQLEYQKENIKSIIEKINDEFFLPDIQRSFVWKPNQVYALFDSLVRKYPISTFLFWELEKDYIEHNDVKLLTFVNSNFDESKINTSYTHDKLNLVLDGQQRLTTFYIALKGSYIERNKKKELYFDIFSGKEQDEDGLLYNFKLFPPKSTCFAEESEEKGHKAKKLRLWINVRRIYEIPTAGAKDIRNFVERTIEKMENKEIVLKNSNKEELTTEVFDNVFDLYSSLTSWPVINYYPEKRQDYDAILDIFVRTNSGGTKLSYSDLLFSKIKRNWGEAREEFKSLLDQINGNEFDFDGDFILKSCLVIFAENQSEIRYKVGNLHDKKIGNIKQNWDKIQKAIKLTISLVKEYGGLNNSKLLPSKNALVPIVYFIYKNNIKMICDHGSNNYTLHEVNRTNQWIYRILLLGVFSGQSDSILHQTKEVLDKNVGLFPSDELNRQVQSIGKSLEVNKDFLEGIQYDTRDSYLLLFLIYKGQKLKINFNTVFEAQTPQQDHIFSQSELEASGYNYSQINDIGNIRYVGASENKWKTDTPFSEWIKQTTDQERRDHLIPLGKWDTAKYPEFIQQRKELILQKLVTQIS